MTVAPKREVPRELIDGLLADYKRPEDLIGEIGLLKQLTKMLVERALDAEMAEHLGHGRHEPVINATGNAPVTARVRRPSRVSLVNFPLIFQGTARAVLSPS